MNTHLAVSRVSELLAFNPTPHLFVMVGVPGVGKSTFVGLISHTTLAQRPFIVASTDVIIDEHAAKLGKTYSEVFGTVNFKQLTKQMLEIIESGMQAKSDIFVDRTNMSCKSRKQFINMAPDYVKVALNFTVNDKVLRERLQRRGEKTGKWISESVLKSMFSNYECPTKQEGFHHVIEVDNT